MIDIFVFSEERAWSKKLNKKQLFFKKICKAFPKRYKFLNKKVSLTLLLSNNKNIKKLNKNFRNQNKSTDILSFPFQERLKKSKNNYIGDIIISYNYIDKPKSQDLKRFKKTYQNFYSRFFTFNGFDHKKNIDYKKMIIEEEKIYQSVISKIN